MEHKIIEKDEFKAIGLPVVVSLKDKGYKDKIKKIWMDFIPRVDEIKNRKGTEFYGLCSMADGIPGDECSFENIAAVEVEDDSDVPKGMKFQIVPASKYFVVTHKGRADTVGETWNAVMEEMKKLGIKEDPGKIFFELYDDRYKDGSDDSEVDLYSAIK